MSSTDDGVTFTYLGSPDGGPGLLNAFSDVSQATTTWPSATVKTPVGASGSNGVLWSALSQTSCGAVQLRVATSLNQGATWSAQNAPCDPQQIDRNWNAAYTTPANRGTTAAVANTTGYIEYHDFASSAIHMLRTTTAATSTYDTTPILAEQPGSPAQLTTTCNTIPGGPSVDQRGAHPGRVYAIWNTSDLTTNATQGCNITQAQAFDHIFLSWSDDAATAAVPTWHSTAVFNDPCAPNPPVPPVNPLSCQDTSELFTSSAVDDAGNVYVAYVRRDPSQLSPEYDAYVAMSSDGGNTFPVSQVHKVNTDIGTHYMPWVVAGQDGAIDIVFYDTPTVEGVGQLGKPAAAPHNAVWHVDMAQSFDHGQTFTQSKVSDANDATGGVYFGDICTTGIFCGGGAPFGWGDDRILFDVFQGAIGPDGGLRVAWTDTRTAHTLNCLPNGSDPVSCQDRKQHIMFACQNSGLGLHGESVSGCGQSAAITPQIPETPWVPGLVVVGLAAMGMVLVSRRGRAARARAD
jgi:hypothetical protein